MPYEKIGKNEPVCIVDEVPFEIPDSWEWARCSSIGSMIRGKGIKRGETVSSGRPCLRYGEIYTSYSTCFDKTISFIPDALYSSCNLITRGDVVFTLTGENKPDIAKAIAYVGNEPVAAGGDLAYWTAHGMNPLYLTYYLNGPYCIEMKKRLATGDIIVHISTDKVGSFLIPIPPLKEQDRIVEQIHLIEPLIREYSKCDELISDLSRKFPEMLKKSILQQAVMGKLVPQDSNDEPASVLLERIRTEKQGLIKAGKLKKDKHESIIYRRDNSHYEKVNGQELCIDEEIPFDIPDSWSWCRLNDLVSFIGGYAYKSENFVSKSEYQVLRLGNIKNDIIIRERNPVFISSELAKSTSNFICKENDILLTMTGTRGKRDYFFTVKIKEERNMYINQRVGCLRSYLSDTSEWLIYALKSEFVLAQVFEHETGTANQGNLGAESIMHALIPLPPFPEQRRIIATLCQVLGHISAL